MSIGTSGLGHAQGRYAMGKQNTGEFIDQIIHTTASDGKSICIRSIRSSDAEQMREGIAHLSTQSRYLRFFSLQPMPSDSVIARLVDADGHDHIAWGAIHLDGADNPAIGAVHAIRSTDEQRSGEFSVAILDDYHGIGLGRMLTAVLLINCCAEQLQVLDIQTLAENHAAIGFIRSIGGELKQWDGGVQDYVLEVKPAIAKLRETSDLQGIRDIFKALDQYL
ncbi:GNAT family N-acetyltransferase [Blastomonas sp. RAC04]|uniref:GNAT family N-acetyltransferase n=1 Tax=Blastomonas sp. RAC04 TaxID=1842535 RepID=UPI001F3BB42C|nr:GNAT family N-acetyltransferase [Blastomonas sp. RAC04]